MSEYEYNIGTLEEVKLREGETIQERIIWMLKTRPNQSFINYEDIEESFIDEFYRQYFIHDNKIYKVKYKNEDPYADVFYASKNENGIIDFVVKYYNGGCSFDDALEQALKNIKE